ncbi:MAG: cupin domain-containing protein [Chloroflexota bacterium]
MQAFELSQLTPKFQREKHFYQEFLRPPSGTMSVGVYTLAAGATDPQLPHAEDEVYYVASGRGQIQVAGEDRPVQAGSIIFVKAGEDHRFHSIAEDLTLLVFFAPAEGTSP